MRAPTLLLWITLAHASAPALAATREKPEDRDLVRIYTTAATEGESSGQSRVHFEYCTGGTQCTAMGRAQGYTSEQMNAIETFAKKTRHDEKVSLFSTTAFFTVAATALSYLPGWQGKVLPIMLTVGGGGIIALKTKFEDVSDLVTDGTEILDPESAKKITGRSAAYLGQEIQELLEAAEPTLSGSAS